MEDRNNLALEVTKHIITVSMAAIGLVVSSVATIFKSSHALHDFKFVLICFVISIVCAVLSQIALVGKAQGDNLAFGYIKDEHIILAAWGSFLIGVVLSVYEIVKV